MVCVFPPVWFAKIFYRHKETGNTPDGASLVRGQTAMILDCNNVNSSYQAKAIRKTGLNEL